MKWMESLSEEFEGLCEGAAWTKKAGKNPEGGLNEKGHASLMKEKILDLI